MVKNCGLLTGIRQYDKIAACIFRCYDQLDEILFIDNHNTISYNMYEEEFI